MREVEAGDGGYPRNGDPLGADRGLGAGRGQKRGGEWTKDTATTGIRRGTPRDGRDLVSSLRTEMEVSAGESGGSQRVGGVFRWMDALLLVEVGGRSGHNREKWSGVGQWQIGRR